MKICDNCFAEIKICPFYEWNSCIFCCLYCVKAYALKLVMEHTKKHTDL
jgi:hypothetical protein